MTTAAANRHFDDFTEAGYLALLESASASYSFEPYGTAHAAPHVLWRHDVDMSMHRALWMARAEASLNLRATYFVMPHSRFYNLAEKAICQLVREIGSLGHSIGLHFDFGFYAETGDRGVFENSLMQERLTLERLVQSEVRVFSFHDPSPECLATWQEPTIAGMINAYSADLRQRYAYCSDSNGYWRHRRAFDVIAERPPFLQMLTHPEWWTPHPLPPRLRVQRCIDGRARAIAAGYDQSMTQHKRLNLRE